METKIPSFIRKIVYIVINILMLYILIEKLGTVGGILGYILCVIGFAFFMYIRQREHYNLMFLDLMRRVETIIWGKALDEKRKQNDNKKTI